MSETQTTPLDPNPPEDKKPETKPEETPQQPSENVLLFGAFLQYLSTEKGHEITQKVVKFFEDWRGDAAKAAHRTHLWSVVSRISTLGLVLACAIYATREGKMDPVLAGLLGTLAGYALGQKNSAS